MARMRAPHEPFIDAEGETSFVKYWAKYGNVMLPEDVKSRPRRGLIPIRYNNPIQRAFSESVANAHAEMIIAGRTK